MAQDTLDSGIAFYHGELPVSVEEVREAVFEVLQEGTVHRGKLLDRVLDRIQAALAETVSEIMAPMSENPSARSYLEQFLASISDERLQT